MIHEMGESWFSVKRRFATLSVTSAWSNSPDKLYIALRDATGSIATSVHPSLVALNIAEWMQWRVPLSDFVTSGLDLRTITRMYLGVGDRDDPQPDGSGLIYIDDIRVIRGDNSELADVTGP